MLQRYGNFMRYTTFHFGIFFLFCYLCIVFNNKMSSKVKNNVPKTLHITSFRLADL